MVGGHFYTVKEDGGVSGDVNGTGGTVVEGQGPLRAVIGGPRPECGIVGGLWGDGCNREIDLWDLCA